MTRDDFNLLCSLKHYGLENQGWEKNQIAHICEACAALMDRK